MKRNREGRRKAHHRKAKGYVYHRAISANGVCRHKILERTRKFIVAERNGQTELVFEDLFGSKAVPKIHLDRATLEAGEAVHRFGDDYTLQPPKVEEDDTPECVAFFGLKLPCSCAELNRRHKQKAFELHSDRRGGNDEDFIRMQEYYEEAKKYCHNDSEE